MKDSVKAIINIPGWAQDMMNDAIVRDRISTNGEAYSYVPLIYRALKLRCDSLASVPTHIRTMGAGNEEDQEWMFNLPLTDLLWKTQAALLLNGAAFWLKLSSQMRNVKQLQFLNPFTIEVKWVDNKIMFKQQTEAGNFGPWFEKDMVYFKEYHPTDDIGKGISAAGVAFSDSQLLRYMTRFSAYFFEGGAMPVTLIGLDKSTSSDEVERVQGLFKQMLTGIKKAWSVVGVRSDVKPQVLTPKMSEMALTNLYELSLRSVAAAFGIPKSLLDDAANYATKQGDYMQFWQTSVRPDGMKIQETINTQLLNPIGLELVLGFDEMDVFQEDEAARAGSLSQLKNAGLPLKLAMEILGYDLTEEQWAMLEAEEKKREEEAQAIRDGITQNQNQNSDIQQDMGKWQKKVVKRLQSGKSAACPFESEFIPQSLAAAIAGALETVTDVEQVKAVFQDAKRWEAYP